MADSFKNWPNLAIMFFDQAHDNYDRAFLWRKRNGDYVSESWSEAASRVSAVAKGLLAQGIKAGDRVMIISENRPEWLICDIAIMSIGAITVPAYITNTALDHRHILNDSGAKAVFVSTKNLAKSLITALTCEPNYPLTICMDDNLQFSGPSITLNSLIESGDNSKKDIYSIAATWSRDQTACIIYTSGTGGLPKGVMLHHGAILHNCTGAEDALREIGLGKDVFLSFLPLSHSYEHMAGQFFPISIGAEIYYSEGIENLANNMIEARPTIMTAVPRLYETLYQRISRSTEKQGGIKAKLFRKTCELGAKKYHDPSHLNLIECLMDYALDKLVRDKIRNRFGGRLKALVSGGAPLNPDIGLFFTALGLRILQGYGQTESAPLISVNRKTKTKMHTVGPVIRDTKVRIAEDGEILCQGELVMQGYWQNEEATLNAIIDGWLHTGDIGHFDEDDHLIITDRKKDIIVNSGGDNIAPQRIEGILCLEPEIGQAMVYGDKHPHIVALIVPDESWLMNWKIEKNIKSDLIELKNNVELLNSINSAIVRINTNLSNVEKIYRFIIADEGFTIDNGEMTPTMKIRRHILKIRYGDQLEALYR